MTRKDLDFIGSMNMCDEISNDAYKKIVCHCEEQEPCEDCISRQAAVNAIANTCFWLSADGWKELMECISSLPSITPYPKTERCKWIRYDYRTICPSEHDIDNPYWRIPEKRMDVLKYCPYCGKEIEVEV